MVGTLADIRRGEEERREAAGVLAQVLSPWIEGNSSSEEIDNSLADIVISLKGETCSQRHFYLCMLCYYICFALKVCQKTENGPFKLEFRLWL